MVFSFSDFNNRKRVLITTRNAFNLPKQMCKVPWNTKVMFCDNLGLLSYTFVELVNLTINLETNSILDIFWRLLSISMCCTFFIVWVTS